MPHVSENTMVVVSIPILFACAVGRVLVGKVNTVVRIGHYICRKGLKEASAM
jgi:hypothetical protein